MSDSRTPASFSILGLMMALGVISLFASVAIPAWFARTTVTLDKAVNLLARDVRAARDLALLEGRPLRMVFDAGGYRVVDLADTAVSSPAGSGDFERRYEADAVFRGVSVAAVDLGPHEAIEFAPAGTVEVRGSVTLEFDGETRVLRISGAEGRIEVEGAQPPRVEPR